VTGPPRIAIVLEKLSRQRVGATASEHHKLMRMRNMEPRRLEPYLASDMGRLGSGSTSGGSYLARGQVDDSW
jgi:hypothetical protein